MNKRIQVGTIVKFLDKDGRMNGGTITMKRVACEKARKEKKRIDKEKKK